MAKNDPQSQDVVQILYVDDEPHHAEAAADALRVVGYEVDIALSAAEAMGIALAESRKMGLALPGLALAEQLYQAVKAQGLMPSSRPWRLEA